MIIDIEHHACACCRNGLHPIGEDVSERLDIVTAQLRGPSKRRQAERHAFGGMAFSLAVERLMLAELLEQDHRQQAGTGPASRGGVERRRSLADRLAGGGR